MKRIFLCLCIFACLGATAFYTAITHADVTQHTEDVPRKGLRITYKMKVTPAAEPTPAFKYRLTVLPHQTVPGNAAMQYMSSLAERGLERPTKAAIDKFGFEHYEWSSLEVADAEVPIENLSEVCTWFDDYIDNFIRRATLCRNCDWGLAEEDLTGLELIEFPLSGIQDSRAIARVVALRTRLAILEERYDDAIDHLRMNYQLGQNVGKVKFMVAGLVGMAEIGMANQGMLSLIAAKDSPNMYWALAELPTPMIDMRDAGRLECHWGLRILPQLDDVETANYSEPEWDRLLNEVKQDMNRLGSLIGEVGGQSKRNVFEDWAFAAIAINSYPAAKRRLVEQGWDTAKVQAMPVAQVLLIDMKREYDRYAQESEKSFYVPVKDAKEISRAAEAQVPKTIGEFSLGGLLANQLLPASSQVQKAQLRIEWQRRALQVIEALRMHLAEHGQFPKSLQELKVVPVPLNPATGEAFAYWLDGDKAIVDLPFSDGFSGMAHRYELEVAK